MLDEEFAAGTADLVLVVTADAGDVDADEATVAGLALTEAMAAEPGVSAVTSHWAIGLGELSPLRSGDGRQALLIAALEGADDEVVDRSGELSVAYTGERDGLVVAVTGLGEVTRQVSELSESDLRRAETLTLPIILLALIVVFGSLVAALLPLLVGIVAVIGTFRWARNLGADRRPAPIVTAAALLLAVLVDAFLIRATLVPAFMRLAGRANWWAPKPLRRFHLRFGIWENEPIAVLDRRDGLVDDTPVDADPVPED